MKQYQLIDKAGKSVNTIILDDDSDWVVPEGHRLELLGDIGSPMPPVSPASPTALSQLEFLRRFTAEERMAIRAATDPVIVDFLHLLSLATQVSLEDPDTVAGVNYCEAAGFLAEGRAVQILGLDRP